MRFKLFLESTNSPVAYHVSYMINVPDIFRTQLIPAGGFSPYEKPHLIKHSKKGVFFCENLRCAKKWVEIMMFNAEGMHDDKDLKHFIPVILKFRLNRNSWRTDNLGSGEVEYSYYASKNIQSQGISFWDGTKWTNNISDLSNLQDYNNLANRNHQLNFEYYPFPS